MATSAIHLTSPSPKETIAKEDFRKCWTMSTADSNLTLHCFRRPLSKRKPFIDRPAGLKHSKKDASFPNVSDTITPEFTFSLLDDEKQSSLRDGLTLHEIYKTRLLRVDLGTRSRTDLFQRWLHRYLQAFRYWRMSGKSQNSAEALRSFAGGRRRWSYQSTILIAEIIGRVTTAVLTAVFLVIPLAILSHYSSKNIQLTVVSVSSFEIMAISAAYAAVLSVFVSSVPANG
ncbi:uncharacterized protein BDR25DRAFT_322559 [Lindgomyces ingoldianus]|uniref:Uncharacterized protein n=1 Tax=Lindgomyces ingoldianus TaxID=673940 RepID=A0ACB6R7V1_9PLEO|nr:uncharacterized protein BDR25DRAFT_322559 [Lindgomyces ingoldianus]KAF2475261.1 hypothetical protein BDR25DRAFT_322559 [Lindgomyces ingoldianus]